MGIEALGSIGRAASAAPSVGRIASVGPSLGRMSMIGRPSLEGGFSVSKITNPFLGVSKASSYVENRAPSLIGPRVDIIKNPFKVEAPKPRFKVADVIAEAELIVSEGLKKPRVLEAPKRPVVLERRASAAWTGNLVRIPEPMVVRLPNRVRGLDVRVLTNPQIAPKIATKVEVQSQIRVKQAVENRPATRPEVQTRLMVEEIKVTKEQKKEETAKKKRTEKQFVVKTKIVEALRVTQFRRSAISEAVQKVKEEDEKKGEKVVITAKKLKKFLLVNFWKYISPLVGERGYDGTIPLTLKAIENNQTEYTNVAQAQAELSKPVAEHIPLEKGEDGRLATWEEVKEVMEGKEKENLRSNTPAEIVIKREVTRENVTVASTGQVVNTVEPTLKDLGLEEVFQKAA